MFVRVWVLAMLLAVLSGLVYAVTVGSSLVAIQENPYDLQTLASGNIVCDQDSPYFCQPTQTGINVGLQDTPADLQPVATVVQVAEQNAGEVNVSYLATCDLDLNTTTVEINISSDPVPTYFILIYDDASNLLTQFTTADTNITTSLSGCYEVLVIYVIANNFGIAGYLNLGVVAPYILGTNIVEVAASESGTYRVFVIGAEALSPVSLLAGEKAYAIAIETVVKVYLIPSGVQ